MVNLEGVGRLLIMLGVFLALLGVMVALVGKTGWAGRLPGDIVIRRDGFTLYFPVVTFLLLSLVLTVVLNVVFRLLR